MWMFAVVAVILCTVVLDFTMGPSGLTLDALWQTTVSPESVSAGTH